MYITNHTLVCFKCKTTAKKMLIMRSFGGDIGKDRNWGIKNIHNTKFYSEKIEARFVLPNTKYSQH